MALIISTSTPYIIMSAAQRDAIARTLLASDYDILGVPTSVDESTLKKAYKAMCKLLHPDKNELEGAEAAFKKVGIAFNALISRLPPVAPTPMPVSSTTHAAAGVAPTEPAPAAEGVSGTKPSTVFGCAKCRWSVTGCTKCRHDGQGGKVGRKFSVHIAPPPMVPRVSTANWAELAAAAKKSAQPKEAPVGPVAAGTGIREMVEQSKGEEEEENEEENEEESEEDDDDESDDDDDEGGLSFAVAGASAGYADVSDAEDDSEGLEALGDGSETTEEWQARQQREAMARKKRERSRKRQAKPSRRAGGGSGNNRERRRKRQRLSDEDDEDGGGAGGAVRAPVMNAEMAKACELALAELSSHELAPPFLEPVDWRALGLPDYPRVIRRPMDIGTVRMEAWRHGGMEAWRHRGVEARCTWRHGGVEA